MAEFRIETDGLGTAEASADRLSGAQTQRSLEPFSTGPDLIPSEMRMLPGIVVVGGDAVGLPSAGYRVRSVSHRVSRLSDPTASGFLATVLAMAGHDLRQPLQIIRGAHDILERLLDREDVREELDHAAEATARLARMLDQLVEALQLHKRRRDQITPIPVLPLLWEVTSEFTESARCKGVMLRVSGTGGAALSDELLLVGMLRNLIRNAIDHTPPGGSVVVASRRYGAELRISVRDTGRGIRASVLPTIFSAFQRGDDSRIDGLGLGLFIVKCAADLLGHRVEVRSVEGGGSRFTIVAGSAEAAPAGGRVKLRPAA
jgi:two-component system phosphate regulon sensor histidine kinase PhoR